ncbi:MAG: competence/damage-inducible protein A [Ruminococcaceae bacterium]|nr:competence/damage-inducible protein A [Oscillospiraceae bacterium]
MICEIVCVGTEILLGDIVNTNAVYLSRKLAEMGISVLRQDVVGDNNERLTEMLRQALERSDIVITTGGLGPTADDITRDKCCEVMDSELVLNEKIRNQIESYFVSKGLKMSESNIRQAYVPKDGIVFENNNGTAPGFAIEKNSKCIIALPGPPREMKPMFEEQARKVLEKYSDAVLVSHNIKMMGIGESAMAEKASDLLENENPTAAPYAKDGECFLRITASGKNKADAEKKAEPVVKEVTERFKEYVYAVDEDNIETVLVKLLKKHNLKIALAESCTGGYAAKRITDISGSSAVFDCGIVSYSNEIKNKILGVNKDDLEKYGAVSEPVAKQMAEGVKKLSGADYAIGITGIAGPLSDGTNKPVGLSYIAVSDGDTTECIEVMTGRKDRDYNRYVNASRAFDLARRKIITRYEEQEEKQ